MINIAWAFPEERLSEFKVLLKNYPSYDDQVVYHFVSNEEALLNSAPDVVITNQYDWVLEYVCKNEQLKWVHFMSAGVDKALEKIKTSNNHDLIITNVKGIHTECMRNYIFSWILNFSQNISFYNQMQANHIWSRKRSSSLIGKTILIYGYGSIGRSVGDFAYSLGMNVIGVKNLITSSDPKVKIITTDQISLYSDDVDYIVISAPLTNATYQFVNDEFIGLFTKSPILINISRSEIVNFESLKKAITDGALSSVVLDVHDEEPLSPSSPNWDIDGIYITPHVAGYTDSGLDLGIKKFLNLLNSYMTSEISIAEQVSINRGY